MNCAVAIPRPGALITFEQMVVAEQQITANLSDMQDIGEITDTRDRIAALEQYLRGKQMHLPALGAMRRLEARIGQLLGPTSNGGRPSGENPRHDEGSEMRGDEKADFRTLAHGLNGTRLTDDEWRQSRRALVALIKERTKGDDVIAPDVIETSSGPRISIPAGVTAEEWCRKGMAMEAAGTPPERVASELGVGQHSYRKMRDIVMLSERDDLSDRDAAAARRALVVLNATEQTAAWSHVESVVQRVYGARQSVSRERSESLRNERFEHAFALMLQACETVADFDIPYLSEARMNEATAQVEAASRNLAVLKRRITEVRG